MEKDEILKLRLKKVPQNAEEIYLEFQNVWKRESMQTVRDFFMWYNNKDVEPTIEAMIKMTSFYHSRQVDMLNLGYTLPNLAIRFLHQSRDAAFFPFCEKDKEDDKYIGEWPTGEPSVIFTRHAKVGETKIRESANVCKSIVGIDASQLYPFFHDKRDANMVLYKKGVQWRDWKVSSKQELEKLLWTAGHGLSPTGSTQL